MPLTDAQCRSAKCPTDASRLRLADGQGMYLELVPSGGKYWRLKYRIGGREKRMSLGVYPAVSLARARQERDRARTLLADGVDPLVDRQESKAASVAMIDNTFEAVARAWHAQWKAARTDHHADYVLRRLQADVFPDLGARPVTDITAPMLVQVAKKIEARGALDIAKRSLQTCGQIFRYAVAHGFIMRNPASDIKPADVLTSRKRTSYARLEAKELPELLGPRDAFIGQVSRERPSHAGLNLFEVGIDNPTLDPRYGAPVAVLGLWPDRGAPLKAQTRQVLATSIAERLSLLRRPAVTRTR